MGNTPNNIHLGQHMLQERQFCILDQKEVIVCLNNSGFGYIIQATAMNEIKDWLLESTDGSYKINPQYKQGSGCVLKPLPKTPFQEICLEPYSQQFKALQSKFSWDVLIAFSVAKYFSSKYDELPGLVHRLKDQISREIDGQLFTVYRRNHGLAHGMRQGFLALDIIKCLQATKQVKSEGGQRLIKWVCGQSQNKMFCEKLQLSASCQRTGRRSEIGQSVSADIYNGYENSDTIYFTEILQTTPLGLLFETEEDRTLFCQGIRWSTAGPNESEELGFIRRVIHCAHQMDLRRSKNFDHQRVQKDGLEILFGPNVAAEDLPIIAKLFDYSGNYLQVTGDRDGVLKRDGYLDCFLLLSNNPHMLAQVLRAQHDSHWETK